MSIKTFFTGLLKPAPLICIGAAVLIVGSLIYYVESGWTAVTNNGGEVSVDPVTDSEDSENSKDSGRSEYIIRKRNGEPLMTLRAVEPGGQFYFGLPKLKDKKQLEEIFKKKFPLMKLTKRYYIGETEVTVEQYRYVMEIWNEKHPDMKVDTMPLSGAVADIPPDKCIRNNVSWHHAMYFCMALEESGLLPPGTRCSLPTEAQFEFAARGGNLECHKYYLYSGTNEHNDVLSEKYDPFRNDTVNVYNPYFGKPNALKIYGMSNHFREWCLDDFTHDVTIIKPEFTRPFPDESPLPRSCRGAGEVWSRWHSPVSMVPKVNGAFSVIGFRIVLSFADEITDTEHVDPPPPPDDGEKDVTPPVIVEKFPADGAILRDDPGVGVRATDDKSGVAEISIKIDGKFRRSNFYRLYGSAQTFAVPLKEGKHSAFAEVSDGAGNKTSGTWSFIIDRTPPVIKVLAPAENSQISNANPVIRINIRDEVSGVNAGSLQVRIDGRIRKHNFNTKTGRLLLYTPHFEPGEHTICIRAEDKVGNLTKKSYTLNVVSARGIKSRELFELVLGESKLKMPLINSGELTIGREINGQGGIYNDPKTAHQRKINVRFYIGETEVSQAMYKEFAIRWNMQYPKDQLAETPGNGASPDIAVTNVSWQDAMKFCKFLNDNHYAPKGCYFTLPPEILWEYAARSGNSGAERDKYYLFSGGNDPALLVHDSGSGGTPRRMASLKPNSCGLYDMSGGVMEWCLDSRQEDSKRLRTVFRLNPQSQPRQNSQTRGGSWRTGLKYCHVISRPAEMSFSKSAKRDDLGFRIILIKK